MLRRHAGVLRRRGRKPERAAWTGADAVLLSHLHHDHAEVRSLRLLEDAPVLTAPENAEWATRKGLVGTGAGAGRVDSRRARGPWGLGPAGPGRARRPAHAAPTQRRQRPPRARPVRRGLGGRRHRDLPGPRAALLVGRRTDRPGPGPDRRVGSAPLRGPPRPAGGGHRLPHGRSTVGDPGALEHLLHADHGHVARRLDVAGPARRSWRPSLGRRPPAARCSSTWVSRYGSPRPDPSLSLVAGEVSATVAEHSERMSEAPDGLAERIASYRATREHIERETLPLATSVDGVTFEFQASLARPDPGARLLRDARGRRRRPAGPGDRHLHRHGPDGDGQRRGGGASSIVLRVARGSGLVLDHVGTSVPRRARSGSRSRRRWLRCSPGRIPIAPGSRSASCSTRRASRRCWTAAASTGTRSCAASPDPARPTHWGCCWNGCWRRPSCASSSSTPTPTTWGWARFGRTPTPRSRTAIGRYQSRWPCGGTTSEPTTRCGSGSQSWTPRRRRPAWAWTRSATGTSTRCWPTSFGRRRQASSSSGSTSSTTPTRRAPGSSAIRAANLGVLGWDIWAGDQPSVLQELESPSARCTVVDLGSLGRDRGTAAGRAGDPLEAVDAAADPAALPRRDRRGPQHLRRRPPRPGGRALHAAGRPDRGRGTQVRDLPARLDPTAAQGARGRGLAVRQRPDDADELQGRHR